MSQGHAEHEEGQQLKCLGQGLEHMRDAEAPCWRPCFGPVLSPFDCAPYTISSLHRRKLYLSFFLQGFDVHGAMSAGNALPLMMSGETGRNDPVSALCPTSDAAT